MSSPVPRLSKVVAAITVMVAAGSGVVLAASPASAAADPCGSGASSNIVVDCGFETGDISPWVVANDNSGTAPDNTSDDTPIKDGDWALDSGNTGYPADISQTLSGAVNGTTYDVSWWLDNPPLQGGTGTGNSAVVTVSNTTTVGGTTTLSDLTNIPEADGYVEYSGQFTATSPAPTLTFALENDDVYFYLDDVSVVPGALVTPVATNLAVTAASSATAGTPTDVTVTAEDSSGNTVTGYAGTVHLTSSDPAAVLPPDATLTNGVGTFPVTFKTAGSDVVSATDTSNSITGSATVNVAAAATSAFLVSAPPTAVAGTPVSVSVTAEDAYGNLTTGYTGTVHLTSTDPAAMLPPDRNLSDGTASVSVTFETAGSQTVTATDKTSSAITGTSNTVAVSPVLGTRSATTTVVTSSPTALTALVTSTDPGTPSGTVTFSVNGKTAGTAPLTSTGTATLAFTLAAGQQTIVGSYDGDDAFAGSSGQYVVTPPTIQAAASSAHAETKYGWYRGAVTETFTCHQGSASVTCPAMVVLKKQGTNTSATVTAVAADGGRNSITVSVMIDTGKPTVHVAGVKSGHSYRHAPKLKCKAKDHLSGVASCTITKHKHKQKHKTRVTYTATATDKAGNVAKRKGHYTVT